MTVEPSDLLTARGATSEVKENGEIIGHVLLMDYDDHSPYRRIIEENKDNPGLTAVFESSPGSYHVHNTTVRTKEQAALQMIGRKMDPMHISVGFRRGRWTIRIGEKDEINASEVPDREAYKSAPQLKDYWVNRSGLPQSKPHTALISSMGATVEYDSLRKRCPHRVGDSRRAEEYLTLKDGDK